MSETHRCRSYTVYTITHRDSRIVQYVYVHDRDIYNIRKAAMALFTEQVLVSKVK